MGIGFNSNLFQPPDYSMDKNDLDPSKTEKENEVTSVSLPSVTDETENVTVGEILRQVSLACEMPELYPKANATALELQERYESLMSKLTRARGQAFHGKSVMFDIYAMMDMIQEISQRLRNVMRELRRLENTAIYANIKAQAEIQRQAAIAGMISGAIMCLVQIGMVVYGMRTQLKGPGAAGKGAMTKTAGNVENMTAGIKNPQLAKANLAKFGTPDKPGLLTPEQRASATPNLNKNGPVNPDQSIKNDVAAAKKDYITAQRKYDEAKQTVSKGGDLPEGQTLEGLKNDADLKGMKYEYTVAKQVDIASRMVNPEPGVLKGVQNQIKGDASQLRTLAKNGFGDGANANSIKGMVIQQVGMAVGQFLQQIASGIKELISAKSTELQAEQKLLEEQFDQIKDLFTLQQGVIEKSIQIFASVIQKESSVLEQIFQHI